MPRSSSPTPISPRTSRSPPRRIASTWSRATRIVASREPEAPGAARHRRPRRRAVPRSHPVAAPPHGELGRADRLAPVARARAGLGPLARARDRLGPRRVPATRGRVERACRHARGRADPARPLWDRHRHGRELWGRLRRVEPDPEARRPRTRRAGARRASRRGHGWRGVRRLVPVVGAGHFLGGVASVRAAARGERGGEAATARPTRKPKKGDVATALVPKFSPPAPAPVALGSVSGKTRKVRPVPPPRPTPVPAGVLIPPLELLNPAPPEDGDAQLVQIDLMGQKLIETLQTFRVEGAIAGRTVGPVVTQYEVAPGPGVKVGRIASLADDLALAMRA